MKCWSPFISKGLGASMKTVFFSILIVTLAVMWNDAAVVQDLGILLDENLNLAAQTKEVLLGGSSTTIDQYPALAAVMYSSDLSTYTQRCGGTIINTRSILTAARCMKNVDRVERTRTRVGSTFENKDGIVHNTASVMLHSDFNSQTLDNDVAIIRLSTTISYNDNVRPASIAGPEYDLNDNEAVWIAGWGHSSSDAPGQIYHVKAWTVNQNKCRARYNTIGKEVTDNMVCAGWLGVGGDAGNYNDGSPLYHKGSLVGIVSWGEGCGLVRYPTVFTRISRLSKWIQDNA